LKIKYKIKEGLKMSTLTRLKIMKEMKDFNIIKEILQEKGINYSPVKSINELNMSHDLRIEGGNFRSSFNEIPIQEVFKLSNGAALARTAHNSTIVIFSEPHMGMIPEYHKFALDLEMEYDRKFTEKLEKMKREAKIKELELSEQKSLSSLQIEEARKAHLFAQREEMRLRKIAEDEAAKMNEMIEQKKQLLVERAKAYGYDVEINLSEEGGYIITCTK